jgi:hypothetical protein
MAGRGHAGFLIAALIFCTGDFCQSGALGPGNFFR